MPKINLTGLRDIRRLKALLEAGEPIDLFDRKTLIGQIIPESAWADYVATHPACQQGSQRPPSAPGRDDASNSGQL